MQVPLEMSSHQKAGQMHGHIEDLPLISVKNSKAVDTIYGVCKRHEKFVRTARSGDRNLNLISLQRMLNLFAATGHINYAKSGPFYVQLMMDLPNKHPWLYQKLAVEGHHVITRTDKFWAGL